MASMSSDLRSSSSQVRREKQPRLMPSSSSTSNVPIDKIIEIARDTKEGLWAKIASYLDAYDFFKFSYTCRRVNTLMKSNESLLMRAARIRSLIFVPEPGKHEQTSFGLISFGPLCPSLEEVRSCDCDKVKDYSDIIRKYVQTKAVFCGRSVPNILDFLNTLNEKERRYVRSTKGFPIDHLVCLNRFSEFMGYFPNLEEIEHLELDWKEMTQDKEIPTLASLAKIRRIDLCSSNIPDRILCSLLRQTSQLRSLSLEGDFINHMTGSAFKKLPCPDSLTHFHLLPPDYPSSAFSRELCQWFTYTTNLQSLSLANLKYCLKQFGDCSKITKLSLENITEEEGFWYSFFEKFINLEHLELERIQDEGTKELAFHEILSMLENSSNLKTLNFSLDIEGKIDEVFTRQQTLTELEKMSALRSLSFDSVGTEFSSDIEKTENNLQKATFIEKMFSSPIKDLENLQYFSPKSLKELLPLLNKNCLQNMLASLPNLNSIDKLMIQSALAVRPGSFDVDMID